MRNALITATYGTLAGGVLLCLAALLPPFGTNPRMAEQLTAGVLICHAAAIPAVAASRCDG
jgi:hypothetical protein